MANAEMAPPKIIDCDAHMTEPADLWTSRAPRQMQERMPKLKTVDGLSGWYLDGELWASTGGNVIGSRDEKVGGVMTIQPFEDISAASWDVTERLRLLDAMGIYAQVLYPNGIGFSSNHIMAIDDQQQQLMVLQVYNDFCCDVQAESNGRLYPQPLLPIWDMDETVREMSRLIDAGIRGFTITDKPELLDLPELLDPYFAPMWDTFNQSGAVVNFHIASGARRPKSNDKNTPLPLQVSDIEPRVLKARGVDTTAWSTGLSPQRGLAVMASLVSFGNARVIANICMSDMFDRYPGLRVVSVESGIGWVPFLLENLEWQLDEIAELPGEKGTQQRRPTEYFRDHMYVTFWFESSGPQHLLEDVGFKNVLVETDLPHPTCLYPDPPAHFAKVLSGWSEEVQRAVLQDNAAELYKIPLGHT